MQALAAIIATIAGVAIVFQLVQNVAGPNQAPVTGLGTGATALTSVTGSLFTKG